MGVYSGTLTKSSVGVAVSTYGTVHAFDFTVVAHNLIDGIFLGCLCELFYFSSYWSGVYFLVPLANGSLGAYSSYRSANFDYVAGVACSIDTIFSILFSSIAGGLGDT